jgi:hypothetical protein
MEVCMRRILTGLCAALLSAGVAQPAWSAWHKASTKHFIIYSDQDPDKLRAYAARLEKFDQAVRHARGTSDYTIGDGNRLTIFVIQNTAAIQRLVGDRSKSIAGFYIGRASGPFAVVPRSTNDNELTSDVVFFHEYSHHMMLQELDRPYPKWLVEGFAEFMSTASFEKDGSVVLGRPANHRALGLFYTDGMPLEALLAGNYEKLTDEQFESIYGRGWLLTHYLYFDEKRKGQLTAYIQAIAAGTPALDAAYKAFGDLQALDRDLNNYMRQRRVSALSVFSNVFKPVAVDVQPLTPGAVEVLPLRIESKLGVDEKTAEPLAAKVRRLQAKYPGDSLVEVTLAEAELDSGHPEASEAAADRALAADPKNTEAMIYKGRAIGARAAAMNTPDPKLFAESRKWFLQANKLDAEDPEPLFEFYKSFLDEGVAPTKNAIAALHYASNLAPQDISVRMNSAMQHLRDRNLKTARNTLVPIAFNPHEGEAATIARAMITRIDAGDVAGAEKAAEGESKTSPETANR